MRRHVLLWTLLCVGALIVSGSPPLSAGDEEPEFSPLTRLLAQELDYSSANLATEDGVKPYYLAYTIYETSSISIGAQLGALHDDDIANSRVLDVDVRVGDYAVDNTHKLRGSRGFNRFDVIPTRAVPVSLDDNPVAIQQTLWRTTDRAFKRAVAKYQEVLTNLKTKVEEESEAEDFSKEEASVFVEPPATLSADRSVWATRVRNVSRRALKYPLIYNSLVSFRGSATNRYLVTSEGTRLETGQKLFSVAVSASTKAEDGMDLSQATIFNVSTEEKLPTEAELTEAFQRVIDQVLALREAPLVEPYTGPAILMNRASGVFFHEIFGHRIEGHRQKDVEEGQTFAKKVGEPVLPDFISVADDPSRAHFGNVDLRGHYRYDDEGVSASRVELITGGILKTFLLSRSPLENFPKSNGHGRRQPGQSVVSRQGNLLVSSRNEVSFEKLREMLIAECHKQEKPYGLLFEDITGGHTTTRRRGPQAFKVLPVVVYRIYADGRPDELVRGVDIVGTPLACFSKIIATGDDSAVFNGTCGAESGWVPVSAVSPSILVSQIEIEKRFRSQERVPILPSPLANESAATPQKQTSPKKEQ